MSCITPDDVRDLLENYCQIKETATIAFLGTTVLASAVITSIADTSTLKPYMKVSGVGIPAGAYIVTVDSAVQITISAVCTANGTGVSLTATYYSQLSDQWLHNRIDGMIVPFVEKTTRMNFDGISSVTEYYDGNGKNYLILNRKPIVTLTEIRYVLGGSNFTILNLQNIEVVASEGILKAKRNYEEAYYLPVFAKGDRNLKVTYTYGWATCPDDIKEAMLYLTAEQALGFIGARTGGGTVSVQGYTRNYGARGKFQDVRNDMARQAHAILSKYFTRVVS